MTPFLTVLIQIKNQVNERLLALAQCAVTQTKRGITPPRKISERPLECQFEPTFRTKPVAYQPRGSEGGIALTTNLHILVSTRGGWLGLRQQ